METYREPLSQVMNQLNEKGYNGNISSDELKKLNPSEWVIDHIHRFEGDSNPDDNSILYAISKRDGTQKTILVNAYGTDTETGFNNFIEKLDKKK